MPAVYPPHRDPHTRRPVITRWCPWTIPIVSTPTTEDTDAKPDARSVTVCSAGRAVHRGGGHSTFNTTLAAFTLGGVVTLDHVLSTQWQTLTDALRVRVGQHSMAISRCIPVRRFENDIRMELGPDYGIRNQ
jgi:hypothetical protein